ncbi:MAG: hypothetical protein AB7S78_14150 [Candidatus Omnitrophota bacterium]
MKTYQRFAKTLLQLLGPDMAVRIISDGFMPLSVEDIGHTPDGLRQIAISHYGEQNGDLMRDPEMVFTLHEIDGITVAEPISFQNDYMGIYQEVYSYNGEGTRTHVNPCLKRELKSFSITWFRNLKHQGFLDKNAKRERLA